MCKMPSNGNLKLLRKYTVCVRISFFFFPLFKCTQIYRPCGFPFFFFCLIKVENDFQPAFIIRISLWTNTKRMTAIYKYQCILTKQKLHLTGPILPNLDPLTLTLLYMQLFTTRWQYHKHNLHMYIKSAFISLLV